jgi:protein-disulfide isomerase-like protein with CxxC motif
VLVVLFDRLIYWLFGFKPSMRCTYIVVTGVAIDIHLAGLVLGCRLALAHDCLMYVQVGYEMRRSRRMYASVVLVFETRSFFIL